MILKHLMRFSSLMLITLLVFSCNRKSDSLSEENNIQNFDQFDPRVKAAYDSAQTNLTVCLDYYKSHSSDTTYAFYIKTSFTEADQVEHMWSIPYTVYDDGFSCILSNDPYVVKNYQAGDTVHIAFKDVEDFIIEISGRGTIGNYLQQVLEKEE